MREIEYNKGEIDGQLLEWSLDGKLVIKDTYQHGRKLAGRTEKAPNGAKKTEGLYLFAKEVVRTPDDWWTATLAVYTKQGKDEKHGPWVSWYPNGQKQAEGEFRNDVQVGKFVWWYANGQKQIEGVYTDGEQQGPWVWWHENGQKSIRGEYTKGHPSGRWTWWNVDGKVARSTEMEQGAGEIVQMPEKPQPQARSSTRPDAMPSQPRARAIR
jgi:antitoxin component YwqK of YwqJK toxin-antitoxin module